MPARSGPTVRDLCRWGALFQAVRDIKRGYSDQDVIGFIRRRWRCGTDQELQQIVDLAHKGIIAGLMLSLQDPQKPLDQGFIPQLPR